MFYAFLRNVIWMFLVLSIIVSIPCLILAAVQQINLDSTSQFTTADYSNLHNYTIQNQTYVVRVSAGELFRNPFNATFNVDYSKDNSSNLFRSDIFVYFNILGVLYVLLHSLFLRGLLVRLGVKIDEAETSPSDFALLVKGVPRDATKDTLKQEMESQFPDIKVVNVNLCYDITQMTELDTNIKKLSKEKGQYKLYLKKEMKSRKIKKAELIKDPSLIPPPQVSDGLFKKKTLSFKEIDQGLMDNFQKMQEFGKNLEPGKQDQLFLGIAIVTL